MPHHGRSTTRCRCTRTVPSANGGGCGLSGRGAREAESDAFTDNHASNKVSRALGYEPNGTTWDTRRGEAALIQRWRLTRDAWDRVGGYDIELVGAQECLPALGLV